MSSEDSRRRASTDVVVLPAFLVRALARGVSPLFAPAQGALVFAGALAVLVAQAGALTPSSLARLLGAADATELLAAAALTALGLVVHELGHAAAAARCGRTVHALGATLVFRLFPALYLQLGREPAGLSRIDRLWVELGGSALQLVYAAVLLLAWVAMPSSALQMGSALSVILAAWQLLPLPAHDGAHALRVLRA